MDFYGLLIENFSNLPRRIVLFPLSILFVITTLETMYCFVSVETDGKYVLNLARLEERGGGGRVGGTAATRLRCADPLHPACGRAAVLPLAAP